MKKIDVSIIIPVFNAEKTIEKCIKSIINQKDVCFELIVINDGSSDKTLKIIKKIAFNQKNLLIINQNNQGVSSSRNNGIKVASGNYVMFIDSDDFLLEDNVISILLDKIKKENVDVISFGSRHFIDNNLFFDESIKDSKKICNTEFDYLKNTIFNPLFRTSVWNKIYRRDIIIKNNIRFFSYNEVISEDTLFNLEYILSAQRVTLLKDVLYGHIIAPGSLSRPQYYKNVLERNNEFVEKVSNIVKIYSKKADSIYNFNRIIPYYFCEQFSRICEMTIKYNKCKYNYLKEQELLFIKKEIKHLYTKEKICFNEVINNKTKSFFYNILYSLLCKRFYRLAIFICFIKTKIR